MIRKLLNFWFEPRPYHQGYLPKADGHEVWFAEFGNPEGKPVLTTHGGPGGRCKYYRAGLFDLKKYHVIMFDQRGCGNSRPFAELRHNTTDDILFDMERLLDFLGIKQPVILHGGSWASTLMLLFAEKYPKRVAKLLLSQIFLADEETEKWEAEELAYLYPDMAEELFKPVQKWQSVHEYYYQELMSSDVARQKKALETYGYFERVLGALDPQWGVCEEIDEKSLGYLRVYAHYGVHHYYVKNNEILHNVHKIKDIPMLIVHNRLDMLCPLKGAYELAQQMNNVKLVIVPEKGHFGPLLNKAVAQGIKEFLSM